MGEETLLSARYETRVENVAHCSYIIIQQNKKPRGSIQIDATNSWSAVRVNKRPMKEAVE